MKRSPLSLKYKELCSFEGRNFTYFTWCWRSVNLSLLQIYQKLAVYLTDWGKWGKGTEPSWKQTLNLFFFKILHRRQNARVFFRCNLSAPSCKRIMYIWSRKYFGTLILIDYRNIKSILQFVLEIFFCRTKVELCSLTVVLFSTENHRTQTSYEDALIIKLFGFQFVNSYTSLFYIAFFRQVQCCTNIVQDQNVHVY